MAVHRDWRVAPKLRLEFLARSLARRVGLELRAVAFFESQLAVRCGRHAVKAALLNDVQAVRRHPMALIVAAGQHVAGAHSEAVRCAEAGGENLQLRAVFAHFEHRALVRAGVRRRPRRAFCVVEIAFAVGLQIECEFVVIFRHHAGVVEVLVKVGLTVLVRVVQARDLITAQHVDLPVHYFAAERLKKACRETLPLHVLQFFVEPAHQPHVAADVCNHASAVGQEVVPAGAQPGLVRIFLGKRDFIRRVSLRAVTKFACNLDGRAPAWCAGFGESNGRDEFDFGWQCSRELFCFCCGRAGESHLECHRCFEGRDLKNDTSAIFTRQFQTSSPAANRDASSLVPVFREDDACRAVLGRAACVEDEQFFHITARCDGESARVNAHSVADIASGDFEDALLADGVAEHGLVAIDVNPAPVRVGEQSLVTLARVVLDFRAAANRPSRRKFDIPIRADGAFETAATARKLRKPALPSGVKAQQLRVKKHRCRCLMCAHRHGHAFVRCSVCHLVGAAEKLA